MDLEELNSIPAVVEEMVASHGRIDILISNADISYRRVAAETDISVDIRLMLVNYFGQVALTKGEFCFFFFHYSTLVTQNDGLLCSRYIF